MGSRERRSEMETQGEEDSYMFYRVQAHGVRWSSPHAASAATGNASPPLRSIPGMVWVSLSSSFLSLSSSGSPNSSSLVSQTPSSFAPVASSSLSMGERERDDRFPYEISLSDIESIEYVSRGVFSKTSSCRFERKLEKGSFVEIDFHKDHSDCKAFVEVIRSAVSRRDKRMRAEAKSERELEDGDDQQTSTTSSSPFFVQGAGVGGIMRRFEERGRQTEASVNDAFQNLDTLFEHASQLVVVDTVVIFLDSVYLFVCEFVCAQVCSCRCATLCIGFVCFVLNRVRNHPQRIVSDAGFFYFFIFCFLQIGVGNVWSHIILPPSSPVFCLNSCSFFYNHDYCYHHLLVGFSCVD